MGKCSRGCRGWAHFNIGVDLEGIERCDECDAFPSDRAAVEAHDKHCTCGAGACIPIQGCHDCHISFVGKMEAKIDNDQAVCKSCFARRHPAPLFDTNPEKAGGLVFEAIDNLWGEIRLAAARTEQGELIIPMRDAETACKAFLKVVDLTYGPAES